MRRMVFVFLALLSFLVSCHFVPSEQPANSALPACAEVDCDCKDFKTQEEAQVVLESLSGDPFQLDGDGNGKACERLPQGENTIATHNPKADAPLQGTTTTSSSIHLTLGNPSGASKNDLNNFLLERSQYALSYNSSLHIANWVSWELNQSWLGTVERRDDFRPDPSLPQGVYRVRPSDYSGSGYDRGHLMPSGDRTRSQEDNSSSFLMSNIIPQSPDNNRGTWRELEEYGRELAAQGKELYLLAGGYGSAGTIGRGARITVPTNTWKVIVVLDRPGQGVTDITSQTRVIAVDMPNTNDINSDWRSYRTTVDAIEAATGYDFLSNVPEATQAAIESRQDNF